MKRRTMLGAGLAGVFLLGCRRARLVTTVPDAENARDLAPAPVEACSAEPVQSDGAGRVDYAPLFEPGMYRCAVCGRPLFSSVNKYEAHTPWPSFYCALPGAVIEGAVAYGEGGRPDARSETAAVCGNCGALLGDVYRDVLAPTGLRYCIVSAALRFAPDGG